MLIASLWLAFAYALGLIMRLLGLPPLVGYLLAGFVLSSQGYESHTLLEQVAHAGVLLLLFGVGLKLRLKSLFRIEVLAGSLLHMAIVTGILLLLLTQLAGLSNQLAFLIAIALSFSSTVVAAKVLEGKRELRAFHGRVAIGILIMQDLVAVVILSVANGSVPSMWALGLVGLVLLRPVFYRLLDLSGHGELIVLYGLLLALVIGGASFEYVGLSSELGALLLGVMLSGHKRAVELANALWGLKEVLLVGFFLQIGLSGHPTLATLENAVWLNGFLLVKALLFFFILLLFRLRARTAFLAGLSLASYSEFGLIIANVAMRHGWLNEDWMIMLALTVALSFVIAAPLNRHAHELYARVEKWLRRFESERRHPDDEPINLGQSHIVIMGMGRVGTGAYDQLVQHHQRVIGLDSDLGKVEYHLKQGRRVLYADAEDPGLWANLNLEGVHAVLLAMPEPEAKLLALRKLRQLNFTGTITATALFSEELELFKKAGADDVYNYYEGVGAGFAERTLAKLEAH
ncbi:MAG: sodium:proton exchanger [Gammaproteobacteria bacterium]|nr:sodium:proton exchanger [Gammaproteobacteria bacterium]